LLLLKSKILNNYVIAGVAKQSQVRIHVCAAKPEIAASFIALRFIHFSQ